MSASGGYLHRNPVARSTERRRLQYIWVPARDAQRVRDEVAKFHAEHAHSASAAERGETFVVPALMAQVQGELVFADSERLSEFFEWSLRDESAHLSPAEFSVAETSDGFEIDLDGNMLTLRPTDQSDQLMLDVPVDGWTASGLVSLVFRQVRADDIPAGEMIRWLTDVVALLTDNRRIPLSALMRCRFILARKMKDKIDGNSLVVIDVLILYASGSRKEEC